MDYLRNALASIDCVLNCSSCEVLDEITSVKSLQFDFGTITTATNNFSDENKLGVGGFGAVYKVGKCYFMNRTVKRYPNLLNHF